MKLVKAARNFGVLARLSEGSRSAGQNPKEPLPFHFRLYLWKKSINIQAVGRLAQWLARLVYTE